MTSLSQKLFEEGKKIIPGGVNSPVRAFKAVGASPLFIREAQGAKIIDMDGMDYIDYVLSWGPMILGHAHPRVIEAIVNQARKGTSYGAPTALEVEMARLITEAFPSIDMIRMVSSGTEAVMSAIRLARGATGRNKIVKFEGCYHGHADSLLVKAGSGVATFGIPGSPGVPECLAELTMTLPYNNAEAFTAAIKEHSADIACVILEPVAGNMGVVVPKPEFLQEIRAVTEKEGIVLIFDEVITGFRFHWGGYQDLVHIKPDLTCLGKIIGGGLPVGAFGGRRELMEKLAPIGPVYQAGTLSGNPLAMAAGIATLNILRESTPDYERIDRMAGALCEGMKNLFLGEDLPVTINRMGSMFTIFFTQGAVYDFQTAGQSDSERFARFFRGMLSRGINLPPSQYEAWFLSFAHTPEDMKKTLAACAASLHS
ncbi:MAG: Glutamate-1-semialdehyde 2,1-aminomutase [Syntrophus sp. SKADARSKE-3]|nr:Glutamate-1-semialdehyde 2,1-aminomutase [Syntrophus sp. SKADARSKE-3]